MSAHKEIEEATDELTRLRLLVQMGKAVVDDFLPNIGRCALQDYERLNMFMVYADRYASADVEVRCMHTSDASVESGAPNRSIHRVSSNRGRST